MKCLSDLREIMPMGSVLPKLIAFEKEIIILTFQGSIRNTDYKLDTQ